MDFVGDRWSWKKPACSEVAKVPFQGWNEELNFACFKIRHESGNIWLLMFSLFLVNRWSKGVWFFFCELFHHCPPQKEVPFFFCKQNYRFRNEVLITASWNNQLRLSGTKMKQFCTYGPYIVKGWVHILRKPFPNWSPANWIQDRLADFVPQITSDLKLVGLQGLTPVLWVTYVTCLSQTLGVQRPLDK